MIFWLEKEYKTSYNGNDEGEVEGCINFLAEN